MFFRLEISKIRNNLDSALKISAEKCTAKRKAQVVSFEDDQFWKCKQLGSETPTQHYFIIMGCDEVEVNIEH